MSTIIPDDGLNWIADASTPDVSAPGLQYVAVGTGSAFPESDDSALANSEYAADVDGGNASLERTSSIGTIRASITISGGTEVEAGSEITELGILSGNFDLVYREVRDPITIENGERVTFEFTVSFVNT